MPESFNPLKESELAYDLRVHGSHMAAFRSYEHRTDYAARIAQFCIVRDLQEKYNALLAHPT